MPNSLQQNILSIVAAVLMLALAISTIVCVIRLQEATIKIQSLQGQVNAWQAQAKDWQENYANLIKGQPTGTDLIIKKMGVTLLAPQENTEITNSVNVQGYANTFEGNVQLRLKDSAGKILVHDFTTACMGDWPCYFEQELKFTQPATTTDATLEAYTLSAKDGSEQDLVSIKVKIKGATIIVLSGPRGDLVDPGPIEPECQIKLENYKRHPEFEYKGFSECKLIESKVGIGNDMCPRGWSPQGCSICKLECR